MTLLRRIRDEEGQALVEFALVLPIILLLLFGMLQFALVLNARQTVAYAAQAAANGYAQTLERARGDAEARTAGAQLRPEMSRAGRVSYSLVRDGNESAIATDGTGAFGDLVVARVTYDFPSPVRAGIAAFRFPDAITLTAEAVARIEKVGNAEQVAQTAAPPTPTPPPAQATASPTPTPTPRGCFFVWILLEQYTPRLDITAVRRQIDGNGPETYAAPGTSHTYVVSAPGATNTVTGTFTLPAAIQDQWSGRQQFLEFPNGRARLTERAARWDASRCR